MLRVVVMGCVEFSYAMAEELLSRRGQGYEVVGFITKAHSDFNHDFKSLTPLGVNFQVPTLSLEKTDPTLIIPWLQSRGADVIFCVGWSQLLPATVLNWPRFGIVGFHPASLPKNRGRHPLIWAIALGLPFIHNTFFVMDGGADSGDIVNQKRLELSVREDARTLYDKMTALARVQIQEIIQDLIANQLRRIPQNHEQASVWRKRDKADGCIDWRMSAISIDRLIRALTRPYVGAHFIFAGQEIIVWKAQVVAVDQQGFFREPGYVIDVSQQGLIIQCDGGAIQLLEMSMPLNVAAGDYLK